MEAESVVLKAAQDGSEPAWRQLFAWHFEAVYRFCLVLAAGREGYETGKIRARPADTPALRRSRENVSRILARSFGD